MKGDIGDLRGFLEDLSDTIADHPNAMEANPSLRQQADKLCADTKAKVESLSGQ